MKKSFLIAITLIICASCSTPATKTEKDFKAMRQNVFDQHDSVMDKMSGMNTLIMKLKPKIDSTEQGLIYKRASQRLKNANQFMMTWMHSFHDNFPDINNDDKDFTDKEYKERIKKLKGTKKILSRVQKDVNHSISYAKLVLKRGKKDN